MDVLLALVRHGLTDWNEQGRLLGRAEIGLNTRGLAQAQALGAALAARRLDAVLASPQRRAQQTAESIAAAHGLAIQTEAELAEVWVGRWQGRTYDELRAEPDAVRYAADGAHQCDTIEDSGSVARRVLALLQRVRGGSCGARVCAVSHGDPIRVLLAHCSGIDIANFRRLRVEPGSVSLVRLDAQRAEVVIVNWRPGDGSPLPE